jgi:Zn-dependent protease
MIKGKVAGVKIGADFTFFAVIAMFASLDTTGYALMSIVVCLVHELGHLLAMRGKPYSIMFRGGGIRIVSDCNSFFVLIAGSLTNIVLFFILYSVFPVFAVMNLVIGLFNLLPIGCLDGKLLLEKIMPVKALRVIEAVTIIAVIAVIVIVQVNFTIIGVIFYVIAVDFFGRM